MLKIISFRAVYTSILLLAVSYSSLFAQDELNPDRPDQTEEVHLVPRGRFQLEAGVISNGFDSGRNALVVRAMLRYGVMKGVELGLLTEQGRERNRYIDETVQSTYPLALRLKLALLEKHEWLPDISLVNYLQLPVAKDEKGNYAKTSVAALVAFLHKLSDNWKVEYNLGFQQEAFSRDLGWLLNTSLHYQVNNKVETFAGSYSQFQKADKPFHNVDVGIGYMLTNSLQVDLAAGTSLNHHPANHFITAGFSCRF